MRSRRFEILRIREIDFLHRNGSGDFIVFLSSYERSYVDELFEIKQNGVLKARGVGQD